MKRATRAGIGVIWAALSCAGAPPAGGARQSDADSTPQVAADAGRRRARAREMGVALGITAPGPLNAITDVADVRVGHVTLDRGDRIRTGATAIIPHGGNLYWNKVPAAIVVGNGYGKLAGVTQVRELGEIEAPIILTNTLNVAEGMAAAIEWTLVQAGNEDVRSVNAVVGETNDGYLNDIRARALTSRDIHQAIVGATGGPVMEGSVGAGRGTIAFGYKGGIGTSSRRLPAPMGGYTVGVLVQSNHGGALKIDGAPFGRTAAREAFRRRSAVMGDGSIMIVVATDAPLSARNLRRLASRALAGLARTGASMTNGSGDYVIAFSTAVEVRRTVERRRSVATVADLANDGMSPLFLAAIEATEEAILNSLFMATTVSSVGPRGQPRTIDAISLDEVRAYMSSRRP